MVRRRGCRNRSQALGLLIGAATLAGLFLMHGLSTHGSGHDPGPALHQMEGHAGLSAAVHVEDDPSRAHGGIMSGPSGGSPAPVRETGRESPDDDSHLLVGLCLAVLAAGLLGHLRLSALNRRTDFVASLGGRRVLVGPVRERRDRDPPSPFVLSVQRC